VDKGWGGSAEVLVSGHDRLRTHTLRVSHDDPLVVTEELDVSAEGAFRRSTRWSGVIGVDQSCSWEPPVAVVRPDTRAWTSDSRCSFSDRNGSTTYHVHEQVAVVRNETRTYRGQPMQVLVLHAEGVFQWTGADTGTRRYTIDSAVTPEGVIVESHELSETTVPDRAAAATRDRTMTLTD
jgi:hypothetical protein